MGLGQTVIKDLVMEYQIARDPVCFSKILKRTDRLLLSTIHKHVRRRNLRKVDLRDLYHSAIVGLGRAALTSPENETPDKVIARIIAYVRLEIDNDHWKRHKPSDDKQVPFEILDTEDFSLLDEDIEKTAEFELLVKLLSEAVLEKALTSQEISLFSARFLRGKGYKAIGEELKITQDGARKRILNIETKLMEWVRNRETIL